MTAGKMVRIVSVGVRCLRVGGVVKRLADASTSLACLLYGLIRFQYTCLLPESIVAIGPS